MKINLNQYIYAELTPLGVWHYRQWYEKEMGVLIREFPFDPKRTPDGRYVFQIWEFMGIFGSFCQCPGVTDLPFKMDVEIPTAGPDFASPE